MSWVCCYRVKSVMGNTASNNAHPRLTGSKRPESYSPSPGNPHHSLRAKKRSLELPDLASLSLGSPRGRQISNQPKTPAIPIPHQQQPRNYRQQPSFSSTTDILLNQHPPSTHIPFPPPTRPRQSTQNRIQELYNQSQVIPPPPPSPSTSASPAIFIPETVQSSIPIGLIGLDPPTDSPLNQHVAPPQLVPSKIVWSAGGKSVFLARAGDDDWKGRLQMERESV